MRKIIALAAGQLFALASVPVHAQTAEPTLSLEEVIVTAEKRAVDLQKTAISIQVYNGEDLKKQGKKRIDEIMSGVIGVQSQDSQVGKTFYMRGVDGGSSSGAPATGAGATVAVMIDGVYQARSETIRGGTLDVKQVEVMRGTQSSNVGANALAGAVSLVTNKPVFEYQASGSLEVGNYHLINMEGVLNVPLTDSQALRFAYATNKRDGFVSSGAGDSDITNARLKYRWQASDTLDLVLTASHQNIGGNGVTQGVLTRSGTWQPYNATLNNRYNATTNPTGTCGGPSQPTCYVAVMGYPQLFGLATGPAYYDRANPWDDGYPNGVWPNNPFRDSNIDDYSAEVNWDLGVGTLTVLPSYEQAHFRSAEMPRGAGTTWMAEDRLQNTQQIDVRLASKDDGRLKWLVGGYYFNSKFSGTMLNVAYPNATSNAPNPAGTVGNNNCGNVGPVGSLPSNSCMTWTRDNLNATITKSLYGDMTFSVLDSLRLKAGLRYSRDKKIAEYSVGPASTSSDPTAPNYGAYVGGLTGPIYEQWGSTVAGGSPASNLRPFTGYKYRRIDHEWTNVAYSTGIEYDLTSEQMVYATYKTGYLPGALNTMGTLPLYTAANKSNQITLGLKSRFWDNKLQVNTEAFLMDFKDRAFGTNGNLLNVGNTGVGCSIPTGTTPTPYVPANYQCLLPNVPMTIDQRSKGVDLEVSFVPTSVDRVDLTLEYLDATYTSGAKAPTYTVAQINAAAGGSNDTAANDLITKYSNLRDSYAGVRLQNAPKYSGNLSYSHQFNLPGGSTLTPNINASYKDAYWSQGSGTSGILNPDGTAFSPNQAMVKGSWVRQDAYTLWNFYTTWVASDGKFSINGYVKNIQNKAILTNLGGEPGSTVPYVSLDAPRTYGVAFSANF